MLQATVAPIARVAKPRIDGALGILGYVALVLYGSLYPFSGWIRSPDAFAFLFRSLSETRFSYGDVVTNVIAYVPLGLLICSALLRSGGKARALLVATVAGLALSVSVEFVQAFLPTRVQSNLDILMNTVGTVLGALLALIPVTSGRLAQWIQQVRSRWLAAGVLADIALLGLLAWTLSRLVPFIPWVDLGKLRSSLSPIAATLADPSAFSASFAFAEAFTWSGFALLLRAIIRSKKPAWKIASALAGGVVTAQILVVDRYLSLEMLTGCAAGLVVAGSFASRDPRTLARLAFFLLFTGFCVGETVAVPHGQLHPFNWVPFRGHMLNTTHGIASLLEAIGVCAALAWALRLSTVATAERAMAWVGGALAVTAALALELAQRRVPGRAGDVTVPLLFAFTWIAVWRARPTDVIAMPSSPPPTLIRRGAVPEHTATQTVRSALIHYGIAWIVLATGVWLVTRLPGVPYNVRELLYAGHPWRSAFLLSAAVCLTIALPAWLSCWSVQRRRWSSAWPAGLVINAFLVWTLVVNAVPSESIHDLVGAPVLGWPGQTESCLRFAILHTAVTLLISGGIAVALLPFHPARWRFALQWGGTAILLTPVLHWVIVTEAATDNLTELMRDGGSYKASALLGTAAVLTFASGSAIAACLAFGRRRLVAVALCITSTLAAYALYQAGTETVIVKYGTIFSAMQFLLSADRGHYAVGAELFVRYAIAYASIAGAVALLQQRAWTFVAAQTRVRQ